MDPRTRNPWRRPWPLQSRAADGSCHFSGKHSGNGFVVAERQYLLADDLAGFMTLAGNQQDIAAAQLGNGRTNRLAAITNLNRAGRTPQDGGTNGGGLFRARIIVRNNHAVGERRGNRSHDRTLSGITIPAATEYHNKAVAGIGAQRLERLCERIWFVGIVDENRRAIALAHLLEPALGAAQMRERRERIRRLAATRDRKACGNQCVL